MPNDLIVFTLVVMLVLLFGTMFAASITIKPYEIPPFNDNS